MTYPQQGGQPHGAYGGGQPGAPGQPGAHGRQAQQAPQYGPPAGQAPYGPPQRSHSGDRNPLEQAARLAPIAVALLGVAGFFLGFAPYIADDSSDDSFNFFGTMFGNPLVVTLVLLAGLNAALGLLPRRTPNPGLSAAASIAAALVLLCSLGFSDINDVFGGFGSSAGAGVGAGWGFWLVFAVAVVQAALASIAVLSESGLIRPAGQGARTWAYGRPQGQQAPYGYGGPSQYGQDPQYGQPQQYGNLQYGSTPQQGHAPQYGPGFRAAAEGQPQPYAGRPGPDPRYAQHPPQPRYGQPDYGAPGADPSAPQYGYPAPPSPGDGPGQAYGRPGVQPEDPRAATDTGQAPADRPQAEQPEGSEDRTRTFGAVRPDDAPGSAGDGGRGGARE